MTIAVISQQRSLTLVHSAGKPSTSWYGAGGWQPGIEAHGYAGVYVGGGIAPRSSRSLRTDLHGCVRNKGRLKPLLQAIPVRIIMNDKVAVGRGAFRHATGIMNMAGRLDMISRTVDPGGRFLASG
jgi:hypothetical protein